MNDNQTILHLLLNGKHSIYGSRRRNCRVCGTMLVDERGEYPDSHPHFTRSEWAYNHPERNEVTCQKAAEQVLS